MLKLYKRLVRPLLDYCVQACMETIFKKDIEDREGPKNSN
jgi:hypothetical protein